jgi:signal transduction histidine kinase
VLLNSVVRRAPDGTPQLTRTALFDATAYRRYEAQLIEARARAEQLEAEARSALSAAEAANRAKARFLAAMNHEFRTPISIVAGFAELLLEAAGEGRAVPTLDWTRDIAGAAAHLLELLEDATRYARLDELGQPIEQSPASLQQTARAGLIRASAVLERAQVTARLDEGEEVVAALNRELAAEAVACTLREFAHRAGKGAELRLRYLDRPARIEVSCPSLRLSDEALANSWAPLDHPAVLNRGLEGAGLGMTIARRIAAFHGGELRLGSNDDDGTSLALCFGPG